MRSTLDIDDDLLVIVRSIALTRKLRKPRLPDWAWIIRGSAQVPRLDAQQPGARFWPDDISIADLALFNLSNRVTSRQVTDIYLLGLACRKSGKFATFDRRVEIQVIRVSLGHNYLKPQRLLVLHVSLIWEPFGFA